MRNSANESESALSGWDFDVQEVSAGVYSVRGVGQGGHRVEATGTDPEALLDDCKRAAAQMQRQNEVAVVDLPRKAREAISGLVHDLVRGRFAELVRDRRIGRLTANELERAVAEYGRTLVDLPEEALPLIASYAVSDTSFTADVPMWTKEEGRSDLTLSVSVEIQDGAARIAIDDIHVP